MNLRDSALAIFHAALNAADPRTAIHRAMQRDGEILRVRDREYDLAHIRRVFVIGFGKAGAAMAQATEEIFGDTLRVERGLVIVKYGHVAPLNQIQLHEAGHPLLDENGLSGTRQILEILDAANENDLVICLISGGGSALLELPVEGISLNDFRTTTDVLLRAGATINELNTVRKHLSQVKGGQLARRAHNALIVSLILSDVIGSPLDTIASGPTAPDPTMFADAHSIVERHGLQTQLPVSVVQHIERGVLGEMADTPDERDPIFGRVQNVVIADNAIACDAAVQHARSLEFNTLFLSTYIQGEARQVAHVFAAIAKEIVQSDRPVARPACIIAGGETTVRVRGNGKGGRNQEFALAAAIEIDARSVSAARVVVLSGGTDGTDGPTNAAGAIADERTIFRATMHGNDARTFLANNDAYHFFQPLNDLIITGPTNTNVNDVIVMLVG